MNQISPAFNSLLEKFSNNFKIGLEGTCKSIGHAIQSISLYMPQNPRLGGVIGTANVIFFFATYFFITHLDRKFKNSSSSIKNKTFKHIFLNGILQGAAIFGFNKFLANNARYSINPLLLTTLTTTTIVGHIFLNRLEKKYFTEKKIEEPIDELKEDLIKEEEEKIEEKQFEKLEGNFEKEISKDESSWEESSTHAHSSWEDSWDDEITDSNKNKEKDNKVISTWTDDEGNVYEMYEIEQNLSSTHQLIFKVS